MEKLPVSLWSQILALPQGPAALVGIRVSPKSQRVGMRCMKPPTGLGVFVAQLPTSQPWGTVQTPWDLVQSIGESLKAAQSRLRVVSAPPQN